MDSRTAIDKIKEAEIMAQEIIEKAKRDSQDILHEAIFERGNLIESSKKQAQLDALKLNAEMEQEADKEVRLIGQQTEQDIKLLKDRAQQRIPQAIEFLKTKLDL